MKFFIKILLFYFLLVGNTFSKILNITNDFKLDVSNDVHFLKIDNIDDLSSDLEILEEYGLSLYVVGNRDVIEFFEKFFNGYNLEEEDWIVELVSKVEKKAEKTKSRSSLVSYTKKESKIFKNIENQSHMYFVHSYEFVPEDKNVISATTDYSSNIVCSVERENIFGTQFHPEKSDKIGLKIISNFLDL